jgi:hypothetical protein
MKWTLVVTMLAGCLGAPPESSARYADLERDATFDDLLDALESAPAQTAQLLQRTGLRPRTLEQLSAATLHILGDQDALPKLAAQWVMHPVAVRATMVDACNGMRENARRAFAHAIDMRSDDIARLFQIETAGTAAKMMFDHVLYSPGTAAQKQLRDYFIRIAWERRIAHARL